MISARELAAMDMLLRERRRDMGLPEDGEPAKERHVVAPKIPVAVPHAQIESPELQHAKERRARWQALVRDRGDRYADCTLASFNCVTAKQKAVVASLRKYCENIAAFIRQGSGLVLFGIPGTGKDHLAMAVCRVAIREGFTVHWVNGMDLFGNMRDAITDREPERKIIQAAIRPDILYLSDPLPAEGDLEKFQASTLFRIIDARYSRSKPTFVTVNVINSDEMGSRMGVPATERLKHGSLCLYCDWATARKSLTLS